MDNKDIEKLKEKTISGLFWRFGERILAQAISFIVSIVLARMLLPADYGIVALVTIFINLADVLVTSGLGTSLVQKKEVDELDFSTMNIASIILSLILYCILFFIAPLIANIYDNQILCLIIRIMGLKVILASVNSIQQAYVQRKMIYKKFFLSTLTGTLISAFIGIYMAITGYGVWALVWQYLTNSTISTIVLFISLKWKPKLQFSWKRFKTLFGFGSKIMASSFIGSLFNHLRGLLIGLRYTSEDLAYNNKGEQIPTMLCTNINTTLESVLFSSISKVQDDKIRLKSMIRRLMKVSSFIIMPIMFGILGVSDNLVKILLTDKWMLCVPFMRVVCIQECFGIINTVNMQAIKAIGKSDTILKLEFIKKPIYLFILIGMMFISPLAVCIGCCIYSAIALIINAKPNKKILNYTLKEQISDIFMNFLLSIIMALIVIAIGKLSLNVYLIFCLQITVGFVVYIMMARFLKLESYYYIIDIIKEKLKRNVNTNKKSDK